MTLAVVPPPTNISPVPLSQQCPIHQAVIALRPSSATLGSGSQGNGSAGTLHGNECWRRAYAAQTRFPLRFGELVVAGGEHELT